VALRGNFYSLVSATDRVEKNPGFLKKNNPPVFLGFSKRNKILFFFEGKWKNLILNYFYCIMQHHNFQNYTIITCYIYYAIQI